MAVEKKRKVESVDHDSEIKSEVENDVSTKRSKLTSLSKLSDTKDKGHVDLAREEPLGHGKSRKRHRKKKLFDDLCQQMEFYFGDANLSKSKFMYEEMSKNVGGWIDLDTFLRFNKLADMMKNYFDRLDIEDLWNALSFRLNREQKGVDGGPSSLLEIRKNEAGTKQIRRNKPLKTKSTEEVEKCTVYIENLPPFVTNDSLKKMFAEKYGPVDYVSLPRYKHNRAVKGFAFIEFENVTGADATIMAFEGEKDSTPESENSSSNKNQRIKPENSDPAELQSVKSFQKEEAIEHGIIIPTTDDSIKDPETDVRTVEPYKSDTLSSTTAVSENNVKSKDNTEACNDDKDKQGINVKTASDASVVEKREIGNLESDENEEGKTSKKRRKRNKNRNMPINLLPHQASYVPGPDGNINNFVPMDVGNSDDYVFSVLRIMTKEEWRKMRNKYLNLQKQNMSAAKSRIRQMKTFPRDKYKDNNQANAQSQATQASLENEASSLITSAGPNKNTLEFVPGTIVRFTIDEQIIDQGKQVKSRIRAAVMEPVKYVDATNGSNKVFVRCSNQKQAEVIAAAKNLLGTNSGEILVGNEESQYWDKIQSDRQDKISGKVKVQPTCKKERGKDKIVKKYENAIRNTHKFFDDGE